MNFSKSKLILIILVLFHAIGLVGMVFFDTQAFASLTMYNLLLSLFLLLWAHVTSRVKFISLFLPVFTIGYLVELLGVKTGFPFGDYAYGKALGVQLYDVPLVIGVNWFMLVMGAGFLSNQLVKASWLRVILASVFMVLVDYPIEQVAPKLDYWEWTQHSVPFQNFVGWFVVAVVMQILFQCFMRNEKNKLAVPYLITVAIFFLILNIGL